MTVSRAGRPIVMRQVLPPEFVDWLRGVYRLLSTEDMDTVLAAAYAAGWTLRALSRTLDIPRDRLRRAVGRGDAARCPAGLIPDPPRWPIPPYPHRDVAKPMAVRLRALQVQAQRVNGSTPAGDPDRLAGVELAVLLGELYAAGFSIAALSRACDVSPAAISRRLTRAGHRTPDPASAPRGPQPHEKCQRNLHPMTGDNVAWGRNSRGPFRLCRACRTDRRRAATRTARKNAASAAGLAG